MRAVWSSSAAEIEEVARRRRRNASAAPRAASGPRHSPTREHQDRRDDERSPRQVTGDARLDPVGIGHRELGDGRVAHDRSAARFHGLPSSCTARRAVPVVGGHRGAGDRRRRPSTSSEQRTGTEHAVEPATRTSLKITGGSTSSMAPAMPSPRSLVAARRFELLVRSLAAAGLTRAFPLLNRLTPLDEGVQTLVNVFSQSSETAAESSTRSECSMASARRRIRSSCPAPRRRWSSVDDLSATDGGVPLAHGLIPCRPSAPHRLRSPGWK